MTEEIKVSDVWDMETSRNYFIEKHGLPANYSQDTFKHHFWRNGFKPLFNGYGFTQKMLDAMPAPGEGRRRRRKKSGEAGGDSASVLRRKTTRPRLRPRSLPALPVAS